MPNTLDTLIQVPLLQEEVKRLRSSIVELERENAELKDRLSNRRPSSAAEAEIKRFCRRCARRLLTVDPGRRAV